MSWLVPLAATVAAALLTYLFCVRPMRRRSESAGQGDFDMRAQQLRADIERMRVRDAGPRRPPKPTANHQHAGSDGHRSSPLSLRSRVWRSDRRVPTRDDALQLRDECSPHSGDLQDPDRDQ
jgi:hypothetical protein